MKKKAELLDWIIDRLGGGTKGKGGVGNNFCFLVLVLRKMMDSFIEMGSSGQKADTWVRQEW